MKTKAVCDATGLTRKTVMFYEEKGLFSPQKVRMNGREYREYTQEDVQRLRDIATLRRAWFTVDEIKRMKEAPEEIEGIFESYHAWLKSQKQELESLLEIAGTVDRTQLESVETLVASIRTAADRLPLPKVDVQPHFRYLEALEGEPRHVVPQTDFSEGGNHGKATMIAAANRADQTVVRLDDVLTGLGTKDYKAELENGVVGPWEDPDSPFVRWAKLITLTVTLLGLFRSCYLTTDMHVDAPSPLPPLVVALVSGLICGALEFVTWRKSYKRWRREILERQKRPSRKEEERHD